MIDERRRWLYPAWTFVIPAFIIAVVALSFGASSPTVAELSGIDSSYFPYSVDQRADPSVLELNETNIEVLIFERVNAFRGDRGMSSLTYDSRLSEIAAYHSRDMAANNYTGHTAPGGETVDDRFQRFAYRCDAVGELVLFTIYGQDLEYNGTTLDLGSPSNLAEGVVGVWRASPSHRGALLSESWERVGIDVAITDDGRVYVTLNAC